MERTGIIRRKDVVGVIVDVQEKLFPVMENREKLERRLSVLLRGLNLLGIPIVVTEQNVRGLGPTIASLRDVAGSARFIEKTSFSCMGNAGFSQVLRDFGRTQVLVAGIETHICVLQTCLDAKNQGYEVFLAADAVSSRLPQTGPIGIERARQAGVLMTSVEGALFEAMERCDVDAFKAMLPIVRDGV